MRKPDFFIVGATRSGTTSLKKYLQEHPEIFMPRTDISPHYFGTDLSHRIIRDEQSYLSLFDEAKDEIRVGEKSNGYLYSTRAALEIKAFQPSAKIVIMLRNPVDVMYFSHSQRLYWGFENLVNFKAALDAEEDRSRGLRLPKGVSSQKARRFLLYRDGVQFAEQVQRYLDTFGRENVHINIFDDFVRDTSRVYKDTLLFLDVAPDFQPEFRAFNTDRRVRSVAIHNFIRSLPQSNLSFMWFIKIVTPLQLRQRAVNGLACLNSKLEPRILLPQELRKQLQAELLPEVEQLSALLGRDLTHWCQT